MSSLTLTEEPVSKLFVSCDLTGATAFKQKVPGWQKVFLSFYREFPQMLGEAQKRLETTDMQFRLWKAIGDELLFEVDVTSERAVHRAVRTWLHALDRYERESLAEFQLSLKGGAFIATFPGPDSRSSIPRAPESETSDEGVVLLNDAAHREIDHAKYLYDYFGPSIDTGFRVIGQSNDRHFTLSVEVAWCVAHTEAGNMRGGQASKDVVFVGEHVLKGVWSARPYPVFAIDRQADDRVNLALSELTGSGPDPVKVTQVCMACFRTDGWPFKIYLPESDETLFHQAEPDAMQQLREHAENNVEQIEDEGSTVDAEEGEMSAIDLPLGDVESARAFPRPPSGRSITSAVPAPMSAFANGRIAVDCDQTS